MKTAMQKTHSKISKALARLRTLATDQSGETGISFLGGIMLAVVVIGLLTLAVNAFFPTFFQDMLGQIAGKLNANW